MPNAILEIYNLLEKHGVFIHYAPEHYKDGSNLCFSIEFTKQKTQTCWYNDNHEFGDVVNTIVSSLKLASWYLEELKRIEMIKSGYHNAEYRSYKEELFNFLETLEK